MELIGILLISMLANGASGRGVKLEVESAASARNKYISIDQDRTNRIEKTRVEQWITDEDDWKIHYIISDEKDDIAEDESSFCNPGDSRQGANVVDIAIKALGVADQSCPIRIQTVNRPSPVIKGDLDIEGHDDGGNFYLTISVMKGMMEAVELNMAGTVDE